MCLFRTTVKGGGGGGSPLTGFPGGTPYAGGGQGANGITEPGGPWPGVDGQPGLQNTGGGGGGGGKVEGGPNTKSGMGGSGVVVVRYQIGELQAQAKATGGLISYYNSKTIHIFTTSGDFNNTSFSYVYNLIKSDLKDSFLEKGNLLGQTYSYNSIPLRIDFILVDKLFKVNDFKIEKVDFTDHSPIISKFTFN